MFPNNSFYEVVYNKIKSLQRTLYYYFGFKPQKQRNSPF